MLQSQGFGSRKHCQQLIQNGAIAIEGEVITQPKQKLQLQGLKFSVYGQDYTYREKVYIALNKPQGYECSHQATHHFSVFDLFDDILLNRGLQCVGRLDQDTTGLLLLTDDGQFLQALTHPKSMWPKSIACTPQIRSQMRKSSNWQMESNCAMKAAFLLPPIFAVWPSTSWK